MLWLLASTTQPRQHIKKQSHYFASKGPSSQSYGFSSSHVWMWGLDSKECWVPKNWCFWTVVLKKTLESSLDCKEIHPVHRKANQSWIFIGRTDAETEAPITWLPDVNNCLIGKDPDSWKDWRQEEKTRGWDGWMASVTQWIWLQRVTQDWVSELNWEQDPLFSTVSHTIRKLTEASYSHLAEGRERK